MRNSFQFRSLNFRRVLLPLAVMALAVSVLSVSQLIPDSSAQKAQKLSPAAATENSSGAPSIVYPESKKVDTVDDYFGTKVAEIRSFRALERRKAPPGVE